MIKYSSDVKEESMDINRIKELLNSDSYDFLRTNKHLKDRIMFLTLGGSHAYGTSVENSDVDIRGIAAERANEILGLSEFKQFENRETDTVIYGFMKIVSLMLNCNPNVIEMLGVKPEHIFILNEEGKLLRDNVDLFLSRNAAYSFGGYANQQLRRLQNALSRDEYPHNEKEKHINTVINHMINTFNNKYQDFPDGSIEVYIDKSEKEDFDIEMFLDINLQHYPLRDFKNIYGEMYGTVKNFGKLNHRNKKDDFKLNKHAMHLVRLFLMGIEILEGKGVNTYRENDRELLLDIRNGKYEFNEIFDMVNDYEVKFKYAKDNSPLPDKPNFRKIEELVMNINSSLLKKDSKKMIKYGV